MRPTRRALLSLSRSNGRMDVWRYRMPVHRLSGGDTVGRIGLHVHVDLGGPLFGCAQAAALRNGANEDPVSDER